MKQITFLLLCLSWLQSWAYIPAEPEKPTEPITEISVEMALNGVKNALGDKDADYYLINDDNPSYWTIFVDAAPLELLGHECYIYQMPKSIDPNSSYPQAVLNESLTFPPSDVAIEPLEIRDRTSDYEVPVVPYAEISNEQAEVAARTYAIIISGGLDIVNNRIRYWNDCSYIYRTLTNKYGILKSHIFPIMADGDNPAHDLFDQKTNTTYSQNLDLDNDGINEIKMSATKNNIQNTFSSLIDKMNSNDHLFVFVTDHGKWHNGEYMRSKMYIWGDSIEDYEFAEMLSPFAKKSVNVNVVMGQCYSGGFIDDLANIGCVVSTSTHYTEQSFQWPDFPYNEFLYSWTSALNKSPYSTDCDIDMNGRITMDEAFKYALKHDRYHVLLHVKTPQYSSSPEMLGDELSFDHIPTPLMDLYIKDNLNEKDNDGEDTGKEPNITTEKFWTSPDIWVRNKDDNETWHQNPIYSPSHKKVYVNVRVRNRGKVDYTGGKYLHVYWAQASTGFTEKVWKGQELYNGLYPTGGHIGSMPIKSIAGGENTVVKLEWNLPNLLDVINDDNFHFCLLARIMDTPEDDGYEEDKNYFYLKDSNDMAALNLNIIKEDEIDQSFSVYMRNVKDESAVYSLELAQLSSEEAFAYGNANIQVDMAPAIYEAWTDGGCAANGVSTPTVFSRSRSNDQNTVEFEAPDSKLENITMAANEFDVVKLKFNFDRYPTEEKAYTFDLIQKDDNGTIIGGERFVVTPPTQADYEVEIESDTDENGSVMLTAKGVGFQKYKWSDSRNKTIGNAETVTVTPTANDNTFKVAALTEDGRIATKSISLESPVGIKTVNVADDEITVELKSPAPENAKIIVQSLTSDAISASNRIIPGLNSVTVSTTKLHAGPHAVTFVIDNEVVDSIKVNVK